jgi:hypothetical protein
LRVFGFGNRLRLFHEGNIRVVYRAELSGMVYWSSYVYTVRSLGERLRTKYDFCNVFHTFTTTNSRQEANA